METPLPEKTLALIQPMLDRLTNEPPYKFTREELNTLYHSFGPTAQPPPPQMEDTEDWAKDIEQTTSWYYAPVGHSRADKTLGYLAILTARKVAPIWEEYSATFDEDEKDSDEPPQMIALAEEVLLEKTDMVKAKVMLCNDFYYAYTGVEDKVKKNIFAARFTAYSAIHIAFEGLRSLGLPNSEFALYGLSANATIDENAPGGWAYVEYFPRKPHEKYKPTWLDPDKSREYWRWWLTEAVPQAWDLAGQFYQNG